MIAVAMRVPGGMVLQRQVLYLGEINDSQQHHLRSRQAADSPGQDRVALRQGPPHPMTILDGLLRFLGRTGD